MSAFVGTTEDIKSKYIHLIPEGLRYCEHYIVFFALLLKDCEIDLDNVETITDLIDINITSYKFVDGLWQYLNSHHDDRVKAENFYEAITNNLIEYGSLAGYLIMYDYLVPDWLTDDQRIKYMVYLIHLIEFYKDDVNKALTYEDLEDPDLVSMGTLENIWSFYRYSNGGVVPQEEYKDALLKVTRAIRDIWEQKREEYLYLVPEYLRTNDGFLVFLTLMIHEFDIAKHNIDLLPDLVNPDKVPMKFINDLGMYINYKYLDRATDEFNRDALMSMRSIWEMRGTDHAVIMAASHGYNPAYVGGDLFIPGYPITNELAELIIGSSRVFIHSRSKFSCIHVYPDSTSYRPGIIILIVPFINDNIRRKIYEVTPAGVRYVFWLFIAAQSDNPEETGIHGEMLYHIQVKTLQERGEPKYTYDPVTGEEISVPANLFMTLEPTVVYDEEDIDMFTHSVSPFPSYDEFGKCLHKHMLSGQRLFNIITTHKTNDLIACALNLDLLKRPFMPDTYTGEYKIAPSGEYLDTIPTGSMPGTSAIRRKFDYYLDADTVLILESDIPWVDPFAKEVGIFKCQDGAVSALPIDLQKEFFAYNLLNTKHIILKDDDVVVVDDLTRPFDLLNDRDEVVGTIDKTLMILSDDRSFDPTFYYQSPSGELLDTLDKEIDAVTRVDKIDYRPDVELIFIPANVPNDQILAS